VAELRQRWAQQLSLSAEATTFVLCVGRMVPKKGFDILLRALAEAPLQSRNVAAVMVGNGDSKTAWQQLARELGIAHRVHWAGTVPYGELGRWYNAADLLAMPSVSHPADGLNVCVLDAMACAKAVVSSDVAGNPLAVVQGETGFIVPEQDAAGLAAAIATLADNPALRAHFGIKARQRIVAELGWRPLAKRYLAHFAELTDKYSRLQA
jgi:glycosyltransferase involved in cell wall biosynthesis